MIFSHFVIYDRQYVNIFYDLYFYFYKYIYEVTNVKITKSKSHKVTKSKSYNQINNFKQC